MVASVSDLRLIVLVDLLSNACLYELNLCDTKVRSVMINTILQFFFSF